MSSFLVCPGVGVISPLKKKFTTTVELDPSNYYATVQYATLSFQRGSLGSWGCHSGILVAKSLKATKTSQIAQLGPRGGGGDLCGSRLF
jgi:hypothetical protein